MKLNFEPANDSADTQPSATAPAFRSNKRFVVLVVSLLLVLSVLLVYNPAVHSGFLLYDDPDYVTTNPHVLPGLTRATVMGAFTSTYAANWHPLTWISHMVDIELFKLNPIGHHLVNVLIHGINCILLFLLLFYATGYLWRSALVGALFALHPLNVESVAWISERKTVLCTLFLLLGFWAYKWYVNHPSFRRYLLVVLCFAFALMSKALTVTFPFLLLLFDYWPLQRTTEADSDISTRQASLRLFIKLFKEKIFLFAMSGAVAVITVYAARVGGAESTFQALPLRFRLGNAIYSYLLYMAKGVWPSELSVFYPHPGSSLALWKILGSACLLGAITILVWRHKIRRYLVTGWFWYLGAMVPMIGIVQAGAQARADRYAYITFIGLFILVVWLAADLAAKNKTAQMLLVCVAAGVLSFDSYLAHRQAGYWTDTITLFSHALEITPNNPVAETDLGAAYLQREMPNEAAPHLVRAVRLDPFSAKPHNLLASALARQGRPAEAVQEYEIALRYPAETDLQASIHNNLGAIFFQAGRLFQAQSEFSLAIKLNPMEQNSFLGRGFIEYQQGNLNAARLDFSHAAGLSPSPLAWYWLGRALEDLNNAKGASDAYQTALQLAPQMEEARVHLDAIRLRLNK